MESPTDFKSLQDQIQSALISTTKTVNQITSEDLAFHRSLNPEVGEELDKKSFELLKVAQSLLKSASTVSGLKTPSLEDVDDVENNWRGVVDIVDSLLEKADISLDEYTGVIKRHVVEELSTKKHPSQLGKSFRNQNLLKPQLGFDQKPQNADSSPWKPLLTSKPHATIPLEKSLPTFINDYGYKQFRHPYENEINQLTYPEAVYYKADPIDYLPVETTEATWVDTFEGVEEMLQELKSATEIAVDLEHHDTRSYVGLVSLMQISTRNKDWIVDTLKPWRQDLQILNEVFADPKILKVFHGAYMDIEWLQRDLGLYVVGLFDTYHACRALGYPGASLAYLLKRFVNFDADKKYQMADWRIRPLPEEMFFYARSDTHFLLYIYDNLRNELVEKSDKTNPENNRIENVLQKSKQTSLTRHEKQVYEPESGKGPGGWFTLLTKSPQIKTSEHLAVFRAVHGWRDQIARKDDDSSHFVMSNHVLIQIAKQLPTELSSLFNIIHPISHNVKSRIQELLDLIQKAKSDGANGPTAMDILKPSSVGAIVNQLRQSSGEVSTSGKAVTNSSSPRDIDSLVLKDSVFWGKTFGGGIWEKPNPALVAFHKDLVFKVPMPPKMLPLKSKQGDDLVLLGSNEGTSANQTTKEKTPIPTEDKIKYPSRHEDDSAFVLKKSRKRKSDAMAAGVDPDAGLDKEIVALDEIDDEVLKAKSFDRLSKKQRRALRRKEKEENAAKEAPSKSAAEDESGNMDVDVDEDVDMEDDEDKVFDYSKAESVLHAKRGGGTKAEKKAKGKDKKAATPFDPYSKSANAPKGMRRQQTAGDAEKGGRSMTFKK